MKKLLSILLVVSLPGFAQQIAKPVLPEGVVKTIIRTTNEAYWGKTVGADGKTITAPSVQAAKQPPIPVEDAYAVVDNAVPTGAGEFCRIEWKTFQNGYFDYLRKQKKFDAAQMLYVERLFKSTHDVVLASLRGGYKCSESMHQRAALKLSSAESFIESEADAPPPVSEVLPMKPKPGQTGIVLP